MGRPTPRTASSALQAVKLSERAHDICGALSKGLRQRAALARPLLSDPEILFLDEPTTGLDPATTRDVHELIDGLRRRGVTIFLTTHRLEEAERLCDRVAILNTTLRTIGRPDELRNQLFTRTLHVRTLAPLLEPGRVFAGVSDVDGWQADGPGSYTLTVADPLVAAPGRHPGPRGGRCRRGVDQRVTSLPRRRVPPARRPGEGDRGHMKLRSRPVRAICRKELREYRRTGSIVVAMLVIPLVFAINPLVAVFSLSASDASSLNHSHALLYLLGIPALVPSVIAAYAVVGERRQGTLEPVLTTPIRAEEFLLGKALAALAPSLVVSYVVYGFVLVLIDVFAKSGVAAALVKPPALLAQILFTPLLAGWSIWIAMAISTRTSDPRTTQQLALLAGLPSVAVTTLLAYGVIPATIGIALVSAAVLLILNRLGWRMVSALFDRERLVASTS